MSMKLELDPSRAREFNENNSTLKSTQLFPCYYKGKKEISIGIQY